MAKGKRTKSAAQCLGQRSRTRTNKHKRIDEQILICTIALENLKNRLSAIATGIMTSKGREKKRLENKQRRISSGENLHKHIEALEQAKKKW